jgi:hypothetical protein
VQWLTHENLKLTRVKCAVADTPEFRNTGENLTITSTSTSSSPFTEVHTATKWLQGFIRGHGHVDLNSLSPRSGDHSLAEYKGREINLRVQCSALENMIGKGRNSTLVIFCFDSWRMLMYCRIQVTPFSDFCLF